jgi:hypothetical protein
MKNGLHPQFCGQSPIPRIGQYCLTYAPYIHIFRYSFYASFLLFPHFVNNRNICGISRRKRLNFVVSCYDGKAAVCRKTSDIVVSSGILLHITPEQYKSQCHVEKGNLPRVAACLRPICINLRRAETFKRAGGGRGPA